MHTADLQGPKLRVGEFNNEVESLKRVKNLF